MEDGKTKNGHTKEEYFERLDYEIGVITKMGFPGYFLIVSDFVKWSKEHGVAIGCGRGSGAGSLVAWCLKITEVDPLEYGLFFERFLNPERVSMPDFDIDFCQENRWKTIEYVMNKYGKESVSRIITYGKMKAKMVLRDVGRVLQISFDEINNLLKLIPNSSATDEITIEKALSMVPRLKEESENNPKVGKMIKIALDLENLNRNTSMHAAGVVIGYKPLIEIGPVCSQEDDNIVVENDGNNTIIDEAKNGNYTGNILKSGIDSLDWFNSKPKNRIAVFGYDMKDCENIGLVKFDFLGLQTLTVISRCCELIKKDYNIEIDVDRIPVDDKKTFDLLATGHLKVFFNLKLHYQEMH
jgi:DNA polymerase-3 subunit alpha